MPYVITAKRPTHADYNHESRVKVTRRAVATLDEDTLRRTCKRAQPAMIFSAERMAQIASVVVAGCGTVGPLPDGTVIDVALIARHELERSLGLEGHGVATVEYIIDAYNTREGT